MVVILHTIYEEFLKLQESVKQGRKKTQINPISFAFRQIGEKSRDFWFEYLKYLKKKKINLKELIKSVVYMLFITS